MLQKYSISREDVKKTLKIREYAIIRKYPKNVTSPMQNKDNFSLLVEETYDVAVIADSISTGLDDLVATLRTRNLFPIEPYAKKIAEAVIDLYDSDDDNSIDLFFNDVDLIAAEEA